MKYKCKLRVILAEKEIKHGDFAERIEVSKTTMSNLINGRTLPTFDIAYKISEKLNMDIREIWIKND
ncbi:MULTISPECIES: helix-turn-helix transcriptional regulator [Bacillaceae]|uniref:helix-turn-helix transcriptional regulator n=1 Tax=Bacillaceae TaxID=186817 RepID=UPI0005A43F76|nr:helix-turn-helix transcriptional regulator [Caldibacillus thermoamylovorans]